jgi:hypothetical protein
MSRTVGASEKMTSDQVGLHIKGHDGDHEELEALGATDRPPRPYRRR